MFWVNVSMRWKGWQSQNSRGSKPEIIFAVLRLLMNPAPTGNRTQKTNCSVLGSPYRRLLQSAGATYRETASGFVDLLKDCVASTQVLSYYFSRRAYFIDRQFVILRSRSVSVTRQEASDIRITQFEQKRKELWADRKRNASHCVGL